MLEPKLLEIHYHQEQWEEFVVLQIQQHQLRRRLRLWMEFQE
jgi:hypothetical protein